MRQDSKRLQSCLDGKWQLLRCILKFLFDLKVLGRQRNYFNLLRIVEVETSRPFGQRNGQRLTFGHTESFDRPDGQLDLVTVLARQLDHVDEEFARLSILATW